MKFNFLLLSILFIFTLNACDKDGGETNGGEDGLPQYKLAIMSPSSDTLTSGESFHIQVNFDENSALTVHHVNVQISDDAGEVIYNMPTTAHVHEDSGHYEHHDDFIPNQTTGSTLTMTAKVWGHEAGISEETLIKTYTID